MEKDLDIKLYNEYLNGEKGAFELLYSKYKDKLQYFIFNIVKDYQKAEDITQDVFIYVLQNRLKEEYSFKQYIYLVAKSRAINYINAEKRKAEIKEKYLNKEDETIQQDIIEIITKNETQKELMEAINMLDDKYKNAIYLVKIEELSYKDTAQILGESVPNVKNLIHRGKKELRKILIKKGYEGMNKVSKMLIILLSCGVIISGVVYATIKIVENINGKAEMTPTYTSKISTMDTNKVWVGTFNLVWNDFMNDVVKGKIEFEDGESELANELNKQTFKLEQLSDNSYFKIHGDATFDLKDKIENGIKQKFNEDSQIIDKVEWGNPEGYVLYAMLKKEFNYLEKFSIVNDRTFGNSKTKVKYFGVDASTGENANKNVEVLFYNSEDDFAVKLKTKEGEDVILYKTTGENKSFKENYEELKDKQNKYSGESAFGEKDILRVPFIKVNDEINYDELCGRIIKGTNGMYIRQALQTIDFELNNVGGSVKSEAIIEAIKAAEIDIERKFIFDSDFILYLKEESKEQPYFALKVDNIDVLVHGENKEVNDEEFDDTTTNNVSENIIANKTNETVVDNTKNSVTTDNIKTNSNSNKVNTTITSNNTLNNNKVSVEGQKAELPIIINKDEEENNGIITFTGTIKSVTDECVAIKPDKEDKRIESTSVLIKNEKSKGYEQGQKVKVSFKGNVTKSWPQNINLVSIEIIN